MKPSEIQNRSPATSWKHLLLPQKVFFKKLSQPRLGIASQLDAQAHMRGWNLVKRAAFAGASSPDHTTTTTATTTTTEQLVAAGLIGFWYTLMHAMIKLPAAVTAASSLAEPTILSSHSERVPPPADSSRKIKLPDLFSPVPGTVSGGFGGVVRWAFNWAEREEMCWACCTNPTTKFTSLVWAKYRGGGAEATPQRGRVSPR